MNKPFDKIKLHGFNNLTKSLSFSIYDICYAKTEQQRKEYIEYIDEQYSADRLTDILGEVVDIIGANILNVSRQDYDPQGASVTILISEEPIEQQTTYDVDEAPGPLPETVVAHLDKSHICVHTYPEAHPDDGICTRVRGFTRDVDGVKHYIDHAINSIQNYMTEDTKEAYQMMDVNVYQENLFHTKMMLKETDLNTYLFGVSTADLSEEEEEVIYSKLTREMQEIFYGRNLPDTE